MFRPFALSFLTISLLYANEFNDYKNQVEKEFNDYYEKEMKAFTTFSQTLDGIPNRINPYQTKSVIPPQPLNVAPKTKTLPKEETLVKVQNTLPQNTPSGSQIEAVKKSQIPLNELIPPAPIPIVQNIVTRNELILDFFGTPLDIHRDLFSFTTKLTPTHNPSTMGSLIAKENIPLAKRFSALKDEYDLNDWETFLLIQLFVNTIYSKDNLKAKTLHASDLLHRLGYKAKVGEGTDKNYYLLLPFAQMVYSKPYYALKGINYTVFKLDEHPRSTPDTSLYILHSPDDDKGNVLSMVMTNDPKLALAPQKIKLTWDFNKKKYTVEVTANKNLLALEDMMPQVDVSIYMQSRSGEEIRRELTRKLIEIIKKEKMGGRETAEFILHFAQKAFVYKTDFDAYGFERPLFLDQTLALPYSDCEDRAILLSHLYREILGNKSVGLHYPGHIALGVALNGDWRGDSYEIEGKKYIVADGTYFYAPLGLSQPEFKGKKAEILKTD